MTVPTQAHQDVVDAYGQAQRRAVLQTTLAVERLWKELAASDLTRSWLNGLGPAMVRAVAAGQLVAASTGQPYIEAMVRADGLGNDYLHDGSRVVAGSFSGVAADGRALDSLLYLPVIRTKALIAGGMTAQDAKLGGLLDMQRMVASEVADAGRGAAGVSMVANRSVTGYVRQVRAGACARCAILAGRWYRYNADFQRHKRCACYGIPATDARPGRRTNPMSFFNGLSRAEQNRRFTAAGAQAIRDGADIYSVVNVRRGMYSFVNEAGRRRVATYEGTSRQGLFSQMEKHRAIRRGELKGADFRKFQVSEPRLMPESIYRLARSRDELIGLLKRYGYLGWNV